MYHQSDAQVMCETIYILAGISPKRVLLFQNIQKEMAACNDGDTETDINDTILKIQNLSRTRWTTRGSAAEVILSKYHPLKATLMELPNDRSVTADCQSKSEGILRKLMSFTDIFKLMAMKEVAFILENNSKILQNASLAAEQATTHLDKVCV